jgi:CHASE3 domain sensor protein
MPRKKKQQIKTNDTDSLEGLLQETYNDACANITDAQKNINTMDKAAEPEDVDDLTKLAKEKTNALKVKESSIKIKLEIAKLQSDIIKHSGNASEAISQKSGGKVSMSDFKAVRKMIENNSNDDNEDETKD